MSPLAALGVLFLNSTLTVRAHKANSHSRKGWETFTTAVLRAVTQRKDERGVVFFAWGLPAQKTCDAVGIDEASTFSLPFTCSRVLILLLGQAPNIEVCCSQAIWSVELNKLVKPD